MIVYFWTKSKVGQGICLGLVLLGVGYGQFVFQKVVSGHQFTVQVVQSLAVRTADAVAEERRSDNPDHGFVASKRGKYYYPLDCSKAKSLSASNMLYFKDISAAEAAGFKAFSGC